MEGIKNVETGLEAIQELSEVKETFDSIPAETDSKEKLNAGMLFLGAVTVGAAAYGVYKLGSGVMSKVRKWNNRRKAMRQLEEQGAFDVEENVFVFGDDVEETQEELEEEKPVKKNVILRSR